MKTSENWSSWISGQVEFMDEKERDKNQKMIKIFIIIWWWSSPLSSWISTGWPGWVYGRILMVEICKKYAKGKCFTLQSESGQFTYFPNHLYNLSNSIIIILFKSSLFPCLNKRLMSFSRTRKYRQLPNHLHQFYHQKHQHKQPNVPWQEVYTLSKERGKYEPETVHQSERLGIVVEVNVCLGILNFRCWKCQWVLNNFTAMFTFVLTCTLISLLPYFLAVFVIILVFHIYDQNLSARWSDWVPCARKDCLVQWVLPEREWLWW